MGSNSYAIAAADMDADGKIDLLVGKDNGYWSTHNPKGNALFKNVDVRGFSFAADHAIGEATGRCEKIATGDMDNDGDQDVLVMCWSGKNVLFINDGVLLHFQTAVCQNGTPYERIGVLSFRTPQVSVA